MFATTKIEDSFPTKFLIFALCVTFFAAAWIAGDDLYNYTIIKNRVQKNHESGQLINAIMIQDAKQVENLVMFLETKDPTWKKKYQENAPALDKLLETLESKYGKDTSFGTKIKEADKQIDRLDKDLFRLAAKGEWAQAHDILHSSEYTQFRLLDTEGLEEFSKYYYKPESDELLYIAKNTYISLYPIIASLVSLSLVWFIVLRRLQHWRHELIATRNRLNKEKMYLTTLMDNMPLAIFSKDAKNGYKWLTINKAAEEIFCLRSEEVVGHVDYDFFPKEQSDFFRATDEKVMAEGKLVEVDAEPVTTPKGTFTAHTLKVPIYDESGTPAILLGILEDVTEKNKIQEDLRTAKEQAERANRAKSDFLAKMSHELRTPLNSVLGLSRLMEEGDLDEENKGMAKNVHKSAEILLEIVNDILDISKIESGNMELEHIGFDFRNMVASVMETLAPVASSKGLALEYSFAQEKLPYIIGDPFRLGRILTNLVSNAIKYTDKGGVDVIIDAKERSADRIDFQKFDVDSEKVEISIESATIGEDKIEILCSVKDTGIGIPENKLTDIFEKFTQADETITRRFGGTGLGLPITKELVEMMGGKIGVKSVVGQGSTFWFKIPFDVTDKLTTQKVRPSPEVNLRKSDICQKPLIPVNKARVLVAEDHLLNQDLMRRLLKKMGFEHFDIVENGELAVEAFLEKKYDLIFMDCHMPGKNGYEATREIRAEEGDSAEHVPIIALTADAMSGTQEKCVNSGMDAYVTKPIDAGDLRATLHQWIDFPDRTGNKSDKNPKSEDGLVDLTLLEEYADNPEDMNNFINTFLKQSEKSLIDLTENCVDGTNQYWTEAAHKFKGGAGMIGAKNLRTLCEAAQNMQRVNANERKLLLKDIVEEYGRVKTFLTQYLSEQS